MGNIPYLNTVLEFLRYLIESRCHHAVPRIAKNVHKAEKLSLAWAFFQIKRSVCPGFCNDTQATEDDNLVQSTMFLPFYELELGKKLYLQGSD